MVDIAGQHKVVPQIIDCKRYFFIITIWGGLLGRMVHVLKTTNGGVDWIDRVPGTTSFTSCFFVDSVYGWVAGYDGAILNSTDGGQNWYSQTSGVTDLIQDIFF